ncbi:class II glutamine amidotransferase [Polyangium sp. 6x1]|uniref:class II glutamine amidotransferase n=1 Tax=Polyangium sp. 6x1 TaxID=3042689 RepID=UPI002482814F|nr:class II glutamine amidotransferase [Polyangium sp. 6x1]MDI1447212.1 class II glutamine amidotransferase [Polyangium sp. 6x1]
MARLVGFVGNRPDLGARVLDLEARHLSVHKQPDRIPGWGVGFYQGGEILLKRRPIDDRPQINIAEMTRGLRADTLIAHVRLGTVGGSRTENTHPFRYRQWLFAHTGTIDAFSTLRGRLSDSLPQFLQRDVRGETDSELLFHLFLSFLHDAGILERQDVPPEAARSALRSSISLVDGLSAEEGKGPSRMNLLIAAPDYVIAMHGSGRMVRRVFQGASDLERILGDGGLGRMRLPDFASCRLSILASDFDDDQTPPGWTAVQDRAIVTLTRTDDPLVEPI